MIYPRHFLEITPSDILKPSGQCPAGTHGYNGEHGKTCCCYDRCCWDKCRSQIPPEGKCLSSFNSAQWKYDYTKQYWVLTAGNQCN